jgi:hypothetical protein
MSRLIRLLTTLALPALVAAWGAGPLAAQRAPLHIEPGHWSWDAIRRLNAAGLAPQASDWWHAPVTRSGAASVFASAEATARATDRPDWAALAAGYRELLESESDTAGVVAAAAVGIGWVVAAGDALGGDGYFLFEDWEGARPLPRLAGPAGALQGAGYVHPSVSWSLDMGWQAGDIVVGNAVLAGAVGSFDVWGGRRRLQYGIGRGGATVLGSSLNEVPQLAWRTAYTFQGLGVTVREPFHLPGYLRFLGPTRIEAAGGRMARAGRVDRPWVAFGRLMLTPFSERLTVGVNRGAIFAGDGVPITARRLFGLLYGEHGGEAGEFENQVFSTLASYRPPLGRHLPLLLYVEWGMDDTSGAVRNTPGVVAGIDVGAVPGVPALAAGLERTSFAQSCCGQPIWFRHIYYRGSWADEGRLFAHPLGGHGREWLAHVRLDLPAVGVLARADGFVRDRHHENLFALERMGRAVGGSVSLDLRLTGRATFRLDASHEQGEAWDASRFSTFLTIPLGTVH